MFANYIFACGLFVMQMLHTMNMLLELFKVSFCLLLYECLFKPPDVCIFHKLQSENSLRTLVKAS